MTLEEGPHHEFLARLERARFEPGDVIDVPDLSLLGAVADRMRTHILSGYPVEDRIITETKPLPLGDKFRIGRPINFGGTLQNPRVTIETHNDALLTRIPDSGNIDFNSLLQFSITADAHATVNADASGGGVLGDYSRQFFMLARLTEQGPVVSLLTHPKAGGTVFEAVPKRMPGLDVSGVMPTALHGGRSGTRRYRR
jgi:hypothetical protein